MDLELEQKIKQAAELLRRYGATSVFVFGSAVSGRLRPDSDVDIAVTGLPPSVFFRRWPKRDASSAGPWTSSSSTATTRSHGSCCVRGNSNVSNELRRWYEFRRSRIEENKSILDTALARGDTALSPLELAGTAWLIETIYTEIEELFKAVAAGFGDPAPKTPDWHRELLDSMLKPGARRGALVS